MISEPWSVAVVSLGQSEKMSSLYILLVIALARTAGAELHVINLSSEVIEVTFRDDTSSDHGLHVTTSTDSLYITTLDGRSLVSAADSTSGHLRLISVAQTMFIQVKSNHDIKDFAVPDAYTGVLSNSDSTVLNDLVHILNSTSNSEQETQIRMGNSLLTLLSYSDLFTRTAAALGERGITGVDYPSTLPFFLTAIQLSQLRVQFTNDTGLGERVEEEDCLSQCPPCPYQQCLGLCGYSCNCWKWVCGDCCYHLGCYEHDICCRKKFVRTACLFPFGFSCENGYSCN